MAQRYENRLVQIEKQLDIVVWTCDNCGTEVATSRAVYFGDERLVVAGKNEPWFRIWTREATADFPHGESSDFCSKECMAEWAAEQ